MRKLSNFSAGRERESRRVGTTRTQTSRWTLLLTFGATLPRLAMYLPLLFPIIFFLGSIYIPSMVSFDSGVCFLALRSMLDGGAFNGVTAPDPSNIANDFVTFMTLWSPGQYLVPAIFIWLGADYGLALSLTALFATLIGVVGWIHVVRSFAVHPFVLLVFVLALNTFPYVSAFFR